jgi:hypothetical protein
MVIGDVTMKQTEINAVQYSVYMGSNSGIFILTLTNGTSLNGIVYCI